MNLRRAAALASIGWYLIFPPTIDETLWICGNGFSASEARELLGWGKDCFRGPTSRTPNTDAPLSKWHQAGEFEHLSDCRQMEQTLCEWENDDNKGRPPEEHIMQRCLAQCFASDDPRLKRGN